MASQPIFDLSKNPEQRGFVTGEESFSAYIGGVGAGKTFGNLLRIILHLTQPQPEGVLEKARGVMGAESFPVLDDVVMPQWEKIQAQIADRAPNSPMREVEYIRSKKRAILKNGARLDFRSVENPNKLRGRELAVFGIDEGRNVPKLAWDRLFDRLRQPGFKRAGFVTSTPNGFDWMWSLFHEDSPDRGFDPYTQEPFVWYNAPTSANAHNLDEQYMASLKANYHGLTLEQEFYGRFVGVPEGAVYYAWNGPKYLVPLTYDPALPLYSYWDFGVGDLGVVIFAQIVSKEVNVKTDFEEFTEYVPHLHVLDSIGHTDWGAKDWAEAWRDWLVTNVGGRRPLTNYGDPAGKNRAQGSATSVIDDLAAEGVLVAPAPKKPQDFSIRILNNMMSGGRVLVNNQTEGGRKLSAALSSHRWPLDRNGQRVGNTPVHDWTSHYSDALRYGAASQLSFFPKRRDVPKNPPPGPGTIGHVIERLTRPSRSAEGWLGPQGGPDRSWVPDQPLGA